MYAVVVTRIFKKKNVPQNLFSKEEEKKTEKKRTNKHEATAKQEKKIKSATTHSKHTSYYYHYVSREIRLYSYMVWLFLDISCKGIRTH